MITDEKLKYALILAFMINSSLVLSNFHERTFDAYTHMFFADHYRRSWFSTWEPKWYGGFSVTSYPPLAHQVIALLSYAIGLEWAYKVLTLFLTLLVPLAVYKFSTIFVSDEAVGYASIIAVFLPSLLVITYVFGQLPTLFSLVTTLFTVYYLHRYLKNGIKLDLALASCLLGVTISTHHFTAVFYLPFLALIVVTTLIRRGTNIKTLVKRSIQFILIGTVLSVLVVYPFLVFTINSKMQPIPHITRTNLLTNPFAFEVFFLSMYGPTLLLIPLIGVLVYRRKRLLLLFLASILLFALGLGGTTILPRMIFGNVWKLLTYDRFALWAGIAFLPLFGLFFAHHYNALKGGRSKKKILDVFFVILILSAIYFGNKSILQPTNVNLEPVLEFLDKNENWNWRYLTLGFGDAKMQELNILTNATTIDGYYFFGRTIPILINSSIGTLDTAKFFGEHGLHVLETVLSNAHDYNLKWIICNDPFYYGLLIKNGFTMLFSQDITADGRFHGVTIWAQEDIPPLNVEIGTDLHTHQLALFEYVWGLAPLAVLIASFVLFALDILYKNNACTWPQLTSKRRER